MPHFETFPLLHTARLDFVEITTLHLQDLYELFTDTRVTEFYPVIPLQQPADAQKIVGMLSQRYMDRAGIRWGITLKGQEELIGTIGFHSFTPGHRATMVYAIKHSYWGKGYVTEAIEVMIQFAFENLQVNRIEAEVIPGNKASVRVLEKNGFKHEGLLRQWMLWEGKHYDIEMYALLKSDITI